MTDASDDPTTLDSGDGDAREDATPGVPTVAARLLALQQLDTEVDQLTIRRQRLPERDDLASRTTQLDEWEQRRNAINARIAELGTAIEDEEKVGAELTAHRTRLEAQLKTVIAPREAEALMHEIATINGQRDELDDKELAALEEQSALADELTTHLAQEEALRSALRHTDDALAVACADIDAELEALAQRRPAAVAELDASVLARYDSRRASSGVAVAQLKGHRCEGCHLDLSAAEVDTAKDEAAISGYTDCPQCGRMLVI